MKFNVDGEDFEIPDKDVMAYVDDLRGGVTEDADIELVPPNKYIFGVNVTHTGELAKAGKDIRAFIDTIGDGEIEVQVSVNAKLAQFKDKVMGFTAHLEDAIGDVEETESDYWDDEEEEEHYD